MKRFLLLIFLFLSILNFAQEAESFRPVFSGGFVGSQVDGDTYGGYNKMGYFAGVGINRKFSKIMEAEFAITFLQKGARKNYQNDSASIANGTLEFYLLRLNYVEVPMGFKVNYKRFKAEFGAAFAYLIAWSEQNQNGYYNNFLPKNYDVSAYLGLGFKLTDNVLLNLRSEYSVLSFRPFYGNAYLGQFPYNLMNQGLYNNLLILSLNYKLPVKAAENAQ